MVSSLKSARWGRSVVRSRPAPLPDLVLVAPRRIHAQNAIPGAVPAYAWLGAGLVVMAGGLALLLRLALAAWRHFGGP